MGQRPTERNVMKINWKGAALLAPVSPTMVTCGDCDGDANIITVGWCGMVSTKPPRVYISVRPERHSHKIISETGEFAINLTTDSMVKAADKCGMYTGRKVDKFTRFGLTKERATQLKCPLIAEAPVSLECRVISVTPMGSHDMFLADVVAVDVNEDLLDEKGTLRIERAHLAAYAHGAYYQLGKKIGNIGFALKKKGNAPNKTQK